MFDFLFGDQHARAHHRSGGERDQHGHQDRGRKRNGELAEQTPDDAAHEKQRNKHGNQRNADGENRKADFLRAPQSRLDGRESLLPDAA